MRIVSSLEEIRTSICRVRTLRKGYITNFFFEPHKVDMWCSHGILGIIETEETAIFLKKDDGFTSLFYCTTNIYELYSALVKLPQNCIYVVDQIIDRRTDSSILHTFEKAGYKIRKTLVRMSKINEESYRINLHDNLHVYESDIPIIENYLKNNFDKFSEQLPTNEELKSFVDDQHIIVKRVNNDIAGFIIYDKTPSTLYLRYWFVNSKFRNQGVGSSLFHEFTKRGCGCKRHMLWVMEDNTNAIIRYKHYGYDEENMKNYVLTYNLN